MTCHFLYSAEIMSTAARQVLPYSLCVM
jgi:hypothetical protein